MTAEEAFRCNEHCAGTRESERVVEVDQADSALSWLVIHHSLNLVDSKISEKSAHFC